MEIEIAKMERMSERGSSLLRLIQNSHTPILDLLIRESVQNSLDAAKDLSTPIEYDISAKGFRKSQVSKHFSGIKDNIEAKFAGEDHESIVIRDTNTTGLTGPLHQDQIEDNKFGNLLKLVYEISMPQEKKEAGGSWGLGKTVYFRVGSGLVIYYSRIQLNDGTYQSRLAACLVEDESKTDALLPNEGKGLKRGIAWWGKLHTEDSTKPLTDEDEIQEILKDFNIAPYEGTDTGTTIIIPFIDNSKLIAKTDSVSKLWWHQGLDLYLNIAMQRWYAPRIDNYKYPYGNYLTPSVGGAPIHRDNMEPVFSILQSLYNATVSTENIEDTIYFNKNNLKVKNIDLYGVLTSKVAGKAAFVKVSKDNLKMGVPDNKKSPYEYIDLPNGNDSNPPIVTFLRKPGMIVSYETEGKWTHGIENTSSDEFIIGIFVPDSDNTVVASDAKLSLDEYLRQGEKADHSSWSDSMLGDRKHTIVDRIKKKVSSAIRQAFNQTEKESETTRSGALSKSLAKLFLPPSGFGSKPGVNPKPKPGDGKRKKKPTGKLVITGVNLGMENTLIMDFEINVSKNTSLIEVEALVESEGNRKFKGDIWEKESEIGTGFPVEIIEMSLDKKTQENIGQGQFNISMISTERFEVKNKAQIILGTYQGELKGTIHMKSYDPLVQASIQENIELVKEGQN
ncbi:hypothetical protein [Virgibacillus sp. L01]|uniref:hypothetical protein n=1 Tax=Virgibacillus sp. L01 TaxID=3457429 RepID=UPI003FD50DE9